MNLGKQFCENEHMDCICFYFVEEKSSALLNNEEFNSFEKKIMGILNEFKCEVKEKESKIFEIDDIIAEMQAYIIQKVYVL
jgi:hypothetical protein